MNNPLKVPAVQQIKAIVAAVIAVITSVFASTQAHASWQTVALTAVGSALASYLGVFTAVNADPAPAAPAAPLVPAAPAQETTGNTAAG